MDRPLLAMPRPHESRKRSRSSESPQRLDGDSVPHATEASPETKRQRELDLDPRILVIHQVICERRETSEVDHTDHADRVLFLDQPRLFAGDSKATALRGRERLDDLEEYLETHEEVVLIIFKSHSCPSYQSSINHLFKRFLPLQLDRSLFRNNRPYFYILDSDGPPAVSKSDHIRIVSEELEATVSIVIASGSDLEGDWRSLRNLTSPFPYFFQYRHKIRNLLEEHHTSSRMRFLVRLLLDCIEDSCLEEYASAADVFSRNHVTWRHLGKLFCQGDVVVTYHDGQPVAYLLDNVNETNDRLGLKCWSWAFDGSFKREEVNLDIVKPLPKDEIPITDLTVYPLRYDRTGLKERLRRRGQNFWDCRTRRYVMYSAPRQPFETQTSLPRYMIDYEIWHIIHEDQTSQRDPNVTDPSQPEVDLSAESPDGLFLLLLPSHIRGYGFHDKKWRNLEVEHIHDVPWNKEAFDRLVLKQRKKELIKALVTVHLQARKAADIIEGKGNGLIILLHGGPGTGKTLTAESVAELAERPLYRVTCGDMGIDAEGVEKYLESVFHIGTAWGCVVLLDEADVFLEERTQQDIQRNALVSVFLRVLEYYEGILILTTNRIGTFDEAFKSRVQLAVHYPSLDKPGRQQIWRDALKSIPLRPNQVDKDGLLDHLETLAAHELNGRQIRSTVQSAMQLAYYKKEKLGYDHFEQIIEVTMEFEDYVKRTHGHSAEEWARAQGIRH